jgi:hypothetical protein
LVYLHNGTLFGDKNQWRTDTCHNTDGPSIRTYKRKKPITKTAFFKMNPLYEMFRTSKSMGIERLVVAKLVGG